MVRQNILTSEQVLRLGDILNTKASALLTHLSIMIGVSIFLFGHYAALPGYLILKTLLATDTAFYLIATLLALYAVLITGPDTFSKLSALRAYSKLVMILRMRRYCYLGAWFITVLATMGLILIVFTELALYTH